jgi:hypothetical protein
MSWTETTEHRTPVPLAQNKQANRGVREIGARRARDSNAAGVASEIADAASGPANEGDRSGNLHWAIFARGPIDRIGKA